MPKPHHEGLPATHGKSGDRAVFASLRNMIARLNERNHIMEQFYLEERHRFWRAASGPSAVGQTVRHDDDHRFGLMFSDQVVQDHCRLSIGNPTAFAVSA